MAIVKDDITIEDLMSITQTGKPVYSKAEAEFLSKYAPYSFSQRPLGGLLSNPHAITEANQIVFDNIVKLDNSVARNIDLEKLAEEKAELINPILATFDIPEVDPNKNLLVVLYEIKTKGLELLALTTESADFSKSRIKQNSNNFQREKKELCDLFGDVPIIVYGSSLKKKDSHDVDTMVFPKDFTLKTYNKIFGTYDFQRKPHLSFVIVPEKNITEWVLSDAGYRPHPENSVMINGELTFPNLSEDWLKSLRIHCVAYEYIKIRSALTEEELNIRKDIIYRINRLLKIPKFTYLFLNSIKSIGLDQPQIQQFRSLPSISTFIDSLVKANYQMYKILRAYQK